MKIAVISGEVEEAVSQGVEMVAELVQPRMSIVRWRIIIVATRL